MNIPGTGRISLSIDRLHQQEKINKLATNRTNIFQLFEKFNKNLVA